MGLALIESSNNPQPQTRLDLIQTDLILRVSAWQPPTSEAQYLRNLLVGNNPLILYEQSALAYENALKSQPAPQDVNDLNLRLGILYAKQGRTDVAIALWQNDQELGKILTGLWSTPGLIYPDAELTITANLSGWYRDQALLQLYNAQQIPTDAVLRQQNQGAEMAIEQLILTALVTVLGGGIGTLLLLGLLIQRIIYPQRSPLLNTNPPWHTPWKFATAWEVVILWFSIYLAVAQILLPNILKFFQILPNPSWSSSDRAFLILLPYLLSMAPMLLIFKIILAEFNPLPSYLFRFNWQNWHWLRWGIGGYVAAIPIVLFFSVVSQNWLGGRGGGNPLLPILATDQANLAKLVLWITVAIAAPFFEELLFRGFLLPSLISGLTPRFPQLATGLSITISGFGFALVHLNLADILPLTALGIILGFIYVRSQNLLAPMLLHGLWNSGTFFTLLVLGASDA